MFDIQIANKTIRKPTSKKSRYQMNPDFDGSDFRSSLFLNLTISNLRFLYARTKEIALTHILLTVGIYKPTIRNPETFKKQIF